MPRYQSLMARLPAESGLAVVHVHIKMEMENVSPTLMVPIPLICRLRRFTKLILSSGKRTRMTCPGRRR